MKTLLHCTLISFVLSSAARAQITYLGAPYTQNFDTLANSGTANLWIDNITLPGWYAAAANTFGGDYRAGTGSAATGDLYSFGAAGSTERALGSVASGSTGTGILYYGARLRNATGNTITGITVSYTGEQWRVGGTGSVNNQLDFGYKINAASVTDPGFDLVVALRFNSPIDSGTAGPLDGNQPANRQSLTGNIIGLNWRNGDDLWIRWTDYDDTGSDHGLGIDQLSFAAVPEPHEYASVAGGVLLAFALWRKRTRMTSARLKI